MTTEEWYKQFDGIATEIEQGYEKMHDLLQKVDDLDFVDTRQKNEFGDKMIARILRLKRNIEKYDQ